MVTVSPPRSVWDPKWRQSGHSLLVDPGDGSGDRGRFGAHRHRVADVQPDQPGDGVVRPEPRVEPHDQLPGRSGTADPGDELVDEPAGAAGGVGGAFPHPGVEDLTGVSPGGQQRVVAAHLGVAEARPLLVLALDLADRRVEIDNQPPGGW